MDMRMHAKRTAKPAEPGALGLGVRKAWPPDQRAIAKNPKIAHIAKPDRERDGRSAGSRKIGSECAHRLREEAGGSNGNKSVSESSRMSSSKVAKRSYAVRFLWFLVFVAILFGLYSAGWFYLANRLKAQAEATIAALSTGGATADCASLEVRGYPFRLGLFCDSLGYDDGAGNIVVTAGSLRSAAQVYRPRNIEAELDSPLRTAVPGLPP